MKPHSIRLAEFAAFAEKGKEAIRARAKIGTAPYQHSRPAEGGAQKTYGPEEFLAEVLYDELIARGMVVRTAAYEVRESNAAATFLAGLCLGQDMSDLHLAVWRRAEIADGQIEYATQSGMLTSAEIAGVLREGKASVGKEALWDRLDAEGNTDSRRSTTLLGVVSMVSVQVLPCWRIAIERARQVGLDLTPGAVRRLDPKDHNGC